MTVHIRVGVFLFVCSTVIAACNSVMALPLLVPDTIWQDEAAGLGNWHQDSNWSNGVPVATDRAALNNGGTINIHRSAQADDFEISALHGGTVNHLRGYSAFNTLRVNTGVFNLQRGGVDADSVTVGRKALLFNRPLVTSSNPTINLDPTDFEPEGIEIDLDHWVPLTIPQRLFEQGGGWLDVADRLSIYQGTFHLKSGLVRADSILIDTSPQVSAWLNAPLRSDGFLQSGGLVDVDGKVLMQDGQYVLERGLFRTGTLALGDPALVGLVNNLQSNRRPAFIQSGGVSHITGDLEMCVPLIDPIELMPFQSVNYDLEKGWLRVEGDVIVGSMSVAPVVFTQSGGRANVGGTLRIEGETSRYDLQRGKLTTSILEVGMDVFNNGGTLSLGESAKVTVHDRISFGVDSVFSAEKGSSLQLLNANFENFSQDELALSGLNNLRLIFDSHDYPAIARAILSSTSELSDSLGPTLEIGGQDLGSSAAGFDGNFALDTLQVGGRFGASLHLVDLVDNQPDDNRVEALYVNHLVVTAGSTLDLGGLPIYYRNAQISGSIVGGTATMVSIVPEPTSVVLAMFAVAFAGIRRRPLFTS